MRITVDRFEDLYDFQKEGVEFLRTHRSALLADEMGLGKTPQALIAMQLVGARSVLVICPASVKYNWKREAINWGFQESDILIVDNKSIAQAKDHSFIIVNYDLAHRKAYAKHLAPRMYDVLVCDESHYLKNHDAKRSKAVFGRGGYASRAIYRWMMTGTPVLNRPVELHNMLRTLAPETLGQFANYIAFTKRFCDAYEGKWGWDVSGSKNVEELAGRLAGFMLRREKNKLKNLPERILRKVLIPTSPAIEKEIFGAEENESIRRVLGRAKTKDAIKYVKDVLEIENKVVVFAYHREVIDQLTEGLKEYSPVVIDGSKTAKARNNSVIAFTENPKVRVFIGQIDAAGIGIDGLQGVCSSIVFAEISYVPGINMQAIGRVHRNGQHNKVVVDFMIVEDSLDENILNKNLFKSGVIKKLMQDEEKSFDFNKPKGEQNDNRKQFRENCGCFRVFGFYCDKCAGT